MFFGQSGIASIKKETSGKNIYQNVKLKLRYALTFKEQP